MFPVQQKEVGLLSFSESAKRPLALILWDILPKFEPRFVDFRVVRPQLLLTSRFFAAISLSLVLPSRASHQFFPSGHHLLVDLACLHGGCGQRFASIDRQFLDFSEPLATNQEPVSSWRDA